MRVGLKFKRWGSACQISHLDMQRMFARTFRRANLDLKYTEGYHPHIIMSFASPLPVGMPTDGDYLEFVMAEHVRIDQLKRAVEAAAPIGIEVLDMGEIEKLAPKLMAALFLAEYDIAFKDERLKNSLLDILSERTYIVVKKTEKKEHELDMRPLIYECEIKENTARLKLALSGKASLGAALLIGEIYKKAGLSTGASPKRIDMFSEINGEYRPLSDMFIR